MSLKTIYFITNHPSNLIGGGVSTYIRMQKQLLSKKYNIKEIVFSDKIFEDGDSSIIQYPLKEIKTICEPIMESGSVIINHGQFLCNFLFEYSNHIFVQHADWDEYWESSLGWRIKILFRKYIMRENIITGNPLMLSRKTFFFSQIHNKHKIKGIFWGRIPMSTDINSANGFDGRDRIMFVGRINQPQKNIKSFFKLEEFDEIDFIGDGKLKGLFKNKKNYLGLLKRKDLEIEFTKHKALILLSNWEGFPVVLTEAFSAGLPVIIADTFDWCKELSDKSFVRCLSKDSYKDIDNAIRELKNMRKKEWELASKAALEYANEQLSQKAFVDGWTNAIEAEDD